MIEVSANELVETISSALLVLTPELVLRSLNRAGRKLFKVDVDEPLDRPLADFEVGHCLMDALAPRLRRIVAEDGVIDEEEITCERGSLAGRVLRISARKVCRPGNHVPFLLLSADDVTAARMAQDEVDRAWRLAGSIVDTVRDPLVVLEGNMTVAMASRSFLGIFGVEADQVVGRPLRDLGEGQWDVPALRKLLTGVVPDEAAFDGYEIEDDFGPLGRRIFRLNARKVFRPGNHVTRLLLVFEDVTEARLLERHRDLLAAELAHRIKNSLQIITSFVAYEIRGAAEACIGGYEAMQARIGAVAQLYDVISRSASLGPVPVREYLEGIAASLRASLLGETSGIEIVVEAEQFEIGPDQAVPVGLVVNELATNAIKYAFPAGRGRVSISFERRDGEVALSVADDGVGLGKSPQAGGSGMGSRFVDAFVRQLGGTLATAAGENGSTFTIRLPLSVVS